MRPHSPGFPIAPILTSLGAVDVPQVHSGGRWVKMRCPFHGPDKTPSASVDHYGFTCFTCGVSGDAIKMMREQGGCDTYQDAVRECARLTGGASSEIPRAGWGSRSLLD